MIRLRQPQTPPPPPSAAPTLHADDRSIAIAVEAHPTGRGFLPHPYGMIATFAVAKASGSDLTTRAVTAVEPMEGRWLAVDAHGDVPYASINRDTMYRLLSVVTESEPTRRDILGSLDGTIVDVRNVGQRILVVTRMHRRNDRG